LGNSSNAAQYAEAVESFKETTLTLQRRIEELEMSRINEDLKTSKGI
jgi:hypothetical protein